MFGSFVFLVTHSAANEKIVEIFAVTTDKRFSPQARNIDVYLTEGHEGTRVKYRYRPRFLNLFCPTDHFDMNLFLNLQTLSEKNVFKCLE
jgi:hypothetical protein